MKETKIEAGLIPVFRLYIGFRVLEILFIAGDVGIGKILEEIPAFFYFMISLIEISILSLYLFWSPMLRKLEQGHLLITLTISSIMPIIAMSSFLYYENPEPGLPAHIIQIGGFELLANLLFSLFLISWQYNFRVVLIFSIGTALLQAALFAWPLRYNLEMMGVMFETLGMRTLVFLVFGYLIVRLMNIQREQRQALKEANNRLVAYTATLEQLATSRERNRMARELHDTLAHTLSGLAVQLDSVTTLWDSIPPKADAMLEEALATTRSGLNETRRALQDLRASPLEDLGLGLAIRTLAEDAATRGNLSLEIELSEALNTFPLEVEHCFYRVAQEALGNVLKHAKAQKVSVHLSQANEHVTLTVTDDGEGFAPNIATQDEHFGLKGIYERAKLIGAILKITSQPGQGTTVLLSWEKNA